MEVKPDCLISSLNEEAPILCRIFCKKSEKWRAQLFRECLFFE